MTKHLYVEIYRKLFATCVYFSFAFFAVIYLARLQETEKPTPIIHSLLQRNKYDDSVIIVINNAIVKVLKESVPN